MELGLTQSCNAAQQQYKYPYVVNISAKSSYYELYNCWVIYTVHILLFFYCMHIELPISLRFLKEHSLPQLCWLNEAATIGLPLFLLTNETTSMRLAQLASIRQPQENVKLAWAAWDNWKLCLDVSCTFIFHIFRTK